MTAAQNKTRPIPYLATLLAWLVPGAGHFYLGRRARGIIVFVTIGAIFWTGVALGGVMTVDYQNERWWFAAEMAAGIHGLVSWYRQDAVHDRLRTEMFADPGFRELAEDCPPKDRPLLYRTYMDKVMQAEKVALVAPAETIARAYAGVAGMLNVMCIFDALLLSIMGVRGEFGARREREGRPT